MNRWYWAGVICAVCFALSWFMPAYMTEEGGAVWPWEIGIGWNNVDADGNPRHDAKGNRIKPNPVRKVALVIFAAGGAACAVAGYLQAAKKRRRSTSPPPKADKPSPPHSQPSP